MNKNKIRKVLTGVGVAGAGLLATAPARAAIDLTNVTFDISPIEQLTGLMLVALAGIWVARKVKGFITR